MPEVVTGGPEVGFFSSWSPDHAGIRPLSSRERIYGFFDLFWNWFGDSANASSWYFGGLLALAGLPVLLWNTFLWSPLIILPWALLALISFRTGATTVLLAIPSLGVRGGTLFLGIFETIVQIGWTTVTTYIGAVSLVRIWMGNPSATLAGHSLSLVISLLLIALAQGFTASLGAGAIRWLKWSASLLLLILGGVETWQVFSHWKLREILAFHPQGNPPFSPIRLFDISFINIWTWLQVGDFARFSKSGRGAMLGSWLGLWIGQAWFVLVGATAVLGLGLLTGHLTPEDSDPSRLMGRLGLSWVALSVIFLSCISVSSSNLYGAGLALLSLRGEKARTEGPGSSLILVSLISVGTAFIPLLFSSFVGYFTDFLTTIGGLFIPLWSLVLTDFLLIRRRRIDGQGLFDASEGSPFWGSRGFNPAGILALLFGILFYYGFPLAFPAPAAIIGVSLPAILWTGVWYIVLSKILAIHRDRRNKKREGIGNTLPPPSRYPAG